MDDKLTIKEIALKKLDRMLNPNFSKNFIWALFFLGSSLIAIPSIGFVADFVIKWKGLEFSLSVIDQPVAYISVICGILIIIISSNLFHKYTSTKQKIKMRTNNKIVADIPHGINIKDNDSKTDRYLTDSFLGVKWEWDFDSSNIPINVKCYCPKCGSSNITPSAKGYGSITTLYCAQCKYMPQPANFPPDQIFEQISNMIMMKLKKTIHNV